MVQQLCNFTVKVIVTELDTSFSNKQNVIQPLRNSLKRKMTPQLACQDSSFAKRPEFFMTQWLQWQQRI